MTKSTQPFDDKCGGLIFVIDEPKRAHDLRELLELQNTFTDTLSAKDWPLKKTELCFISMPDYPTAHDEIPKLHYVAVVRKTRIAASYKDGLRFELVSRISDLLITDLINNAEDKFKKRLENLLAERAVKIPPRTWTELISVISKISPETKIILEELDRNRNPVIPKISKGTKATISEEKDAIGLALKIFGADYKKGLRDWKPSASFESGQTLDGFKLLAENNRAPFLKGLNKVISREDSMINFDATNFLRWATVENSQVSTVEFENYEDRLTIINANRTTIEETLGVDLIYYNHRYDSYVMVQYKRLLEEKNGGETGKYYRPDSDGSYPVEKRKMTDHEKRRGRPFSKSIDLKDFRLNDDIFYFKLCDSVNEEFFSSKLIKGMYFPLEHWNLMMNSNQVKGPKGGIRIGYPSVDRYINNDLFTDLLKNGWIGSRISEGKKLSDLLKTLLAGNRSLILAATSDLRNS